MKSTISRGAGGYWSVLANEDLDNDGAPDVVATSIDGDNYAAFGHRSGSPDNKRKKNVITKREKT